MLNPEARHLDLAEHAETSNTMNKSKQRAHAVFVVQRSECTYLDYEDEFLVYMFDSSRQTIEQKVFEDLVEARNLH